MESYCLLFYPCMYTQFYMEKFPWYLILSASNKLLTLSFRIRIKTTLILYSFYLNKIIFYNYQGGPFVRPSVRNGQLFIVLFDSLNEKAQYYKRSNLVALILYRVVRSNPLDFKKRHAIMLQYLFLQSVYHYQDMEIPFIKNRDH